ncbi:RNA polymerase-associated protein CTR9 homolog [Coccomyxa sp. Obi]|nr:RNA polymerase-associated protein CTR9 homolog [Coccomyxa sp. Obi]
MSSYAPIDSDVHLFIPVALTDETVAVPVDDLPEEAEDVLNLLRGEEAPLSLWIDFAKAYLAQGNLKQYLYILEEGITDEVAQYFQQAKFERLQIFCALAAYYTAEGRKQRDRNARTEQFARAAQLLGSARQIDYEDQLPLLGLGQLELARGDMESAKRHFTSAAMAKCNGRPNIAGTLALASVHFQQGNYNNALGHYRKALREHPGAPAEVRLGLAACLFRLGQVSQAKAAYQRTLDLSPSSGEALLGLAVIAFNSKDAEKGLREGLDLLCRAYDADPGQPGVLTLLARFCIQRGDWQRAKELAAAAHQAAEFDSTRALALTLQARAHHAEGNYNLAYRAYQQASKLDPKLPLPLYGLAQIMVRQREQTNAISLLESALAQVPGWPDALHMVGQLYPLAERKGQTAVDHFRDAAEANSTSGAVWEMLGELLATSDPPGSLRAYKRSLQLYREAAEKDREHRLRRLRARKKANSSLATENGNQVHNAEEDEEAANRLDPLPAKLLNNAAILHMRAGEARAALDLMQEATRAAKEDKSGALPASANVTLGFNQARVQEAAGNIEAAARSYKDMLEAFPGYTDCLLRLACIAKHRGDHAQALEWSQKALEAKPGLPDALAMQGWLHLEAKDFKRAEETFMVLIKEPSTKNDAYGWLGLACLNFASAPSHQKKEEDIVKARKLYGRAMEYFKHILEKNSNNIYAANGIAAIMAELGDIEPAQKIFNQVQEAAAASESFLQMPDAFINMGSLFLALDKPKLAIQVYTSVLRKSFHGCQPTLLLYLSRAYYDAGDLKEARSVLLKAVHLAPSDHRLHFNIALTMQQYAVRLLKQSRAEGDVSRLAEFEEAVMDLLQAHRFFDKLRSLGHHRTGIEPKKLDEHVSFCAQTHAKANTYLAQAKAEAKLQEARREESRVRMEAAQRQREVAAERARIEAERKAAENERIARETAANLERMRAAWAESQALQQAAEQGDAGKADKRRKKNKAAAEEAQFYVEDDDEAEYQAPEGQNSRLAGTGLESSDEEEYQENGEEGAAGVDGDDDAGEAAANDEAGALQSPGGRSGRLLKRPREAASEQQQANGLEDDDMEDAAPVEEEVNEGEDEQGAKRSRMTHIFGDSDEED